MADLVIRGERLAFRLLKIAEQEQRSVEDVIEQWAEEHYPQTQSSVPQPGTLDALVRAALSAGIASPHEVDTADRSREILANEYADYLKRRMDEQDNPG
jgi:cell wall assembly regulator SMI1